MAGASNAPTVRLISSGEANADEATEYQRGRMAAQVCRNCASGSSMAGRRASRSVTDTRGELSSAWRSARAASSAGPSPSQRARRARVSGQRV